MPAPTLPTGVQSIGPGYIYTAPLGTTEPTSSVTGSVFTDAWPAGWVAVGYTDDGHVFTYESTTDAAEAAESFDPLAYGTVARAASIAFGFLGLTAANMKRSLNG